MVEEAKLSQTADAERVEAAPPIHLPSPSIWPAALGFGVALLLFGVLTHWAFSVAGAGLFIWAIARWITQIRHESEGESPGHEDHEHHEGHD